MFIQVEPMRRYGFYLLMALALRLPAVGGDLSGDLFSMALTWTDLLLPRSYRQRFFTYF